MIEHILVGIALGAMTFALSLVPDEMARRTRAGEPQGGAVLAFIFVLSVIAIASAAGLRDHEEIKELKARVEALEPKQEATNEQN